MDMLSTPAILCCVMPLSSVVSCPGTVLVVRWYLFSEVVLIPQALHQPFRLSYSCSGGVFASDWRQDWNYRELEVAFGNNFNRISYAAVFRNKKHRSVLMSGISTVSQGWSRVTRVRRICSHYVSGSLAD